MSARKNAQKSLVVMAFGLLAGVLCAGATICAANAEPISPEVQAKVEQYKKKLREWAANPVFITAVKEANAKGGMVPGMTNAKWDELKEHDPVVMSFQTSAAGKLLSKLEGDKGISKLYLRDEKGNLVAGSNKPLLFNNASRIPFKSAIGGKVFSESEIKSDPTTLEKSVQASAPILDGGKPIGVIHTAVSAN